MRTGFLALTLAAVALCTACKDNRDHMGPFYDKPPFSDMVRLRDNIGIDMRNVQGFTLAPVKLPAPAAPQYAPMSGDCISVGAGMQGAQTAGCINLFALAATGLVPVTLFELPQQTGYNGPNGATGSTGKECCQNGGMSLVPQTIFNVGKFVLFVYNNPLNVGAGKCSMVILRKADGALFCSADALANCGGNTNGCMGSTSMDRIVQTATEIDLVYGMRPDNALMRFDFSNPASAVATVLIDQSDGMVGPFMVNAGGDALVNFNTTNSPVTDLRYYKRTNGFSTLQALSTQGGGGMSGGALCTFAGPGTANTDFFVVTPPYNTWNTSNYLPQSLSSRVLRIHMDEATQQVTYTTYAADPGNNTWNQGYGPCGGAYQGNTGDRHFIFWLGQNSTPILFEAYNPAGTPVAHTISGFSNVTRVFTCRTNVVLAGRNPAGNDIIVRYDPVTTGTQTVLSSSDYTISQVDVSEGCDITFGGRRSSDNSRIIGNIPAGTTTVNVYSNALDGDVKQLVRIR